jgi:RNA polymerase sigma-70 factor (ECF subfamily)
MAASPGWAQEEAGVSVQTMPPVVVKTVPEAGDTSVDPAIKEIRVTFSKPMTDKSWSWSQISNETFPKSPGKPRYLKDGKTCVLPVELEPGKTYVIWLNSQKFRNFRDKGGQPAVPYLLVFQTKSANSGPIE